MSFLKDKASGAVTLDLDSGGLLYQNLIGLRDPVTNFPRYEEVAEEDIVETAARILAIRAPGATILADESVAAPVAPGRPGTITKCVYVANSPGIVGAATNSRTITVVQGTAPGATVARTTLCTGAFVAAFNAPTGLDSSLFTINSAGLIGAVPPEVISTHIGTGIVDPGGLIVITYTPV